MSRIGTLLGHAFERQGTAEVLRQSEEKYRALADTASNAIITIDESSKILYANPATERIFGYPVAELLDQEATILMPTYLRELHRGALIRYTETGKKHMSWYRVELSALHKKGHEFPIELSLA
jgi:PAS domain S-box-containing protein